jgi:hypothetical protein
VDADGQRLAGDDGPANLGFGGLVGSYGVKRNINEHGHRRLLGGFLDVKNRAALVDAALRAGLVRQLLLVTARALGDSHGGEEIVRAAESGAARGVASFRIRHFKFLSYRVPLRFRPASGHTLP